jgi:hypothetical protein
MIIQLNYGQLKRIVEQVIKENVQKNGKRKRIMEQVDPYLDKNYVQPLLAKGYTIVDKINVPDGKYQLVGGGYQFNISDMANKRGLPYVVITINGFKSGRDQQSIDIEIIGGQIQGEIFKPYKILLMPGKKG